VADKEIANSMLKFSFPFSINIILWRIETTTDILPFSAHQLYCDDHGKQTLLSLSGCSLTSLKAHIWRE